MSLFNNLKNILGFPETENENTADMQESVERTPYINPFKDETHHVPAPSEEPANQRPSLSIADIDEKMRMKIIEKLIDILNTSLPDYTKKYIDRNAQIQYIRQLIAADFDEAMSEITKNSRRCQASKGSLRKKRKPKKPHDEPRTPKSGAQRANRSIGSKNGNGRSRKRAIPIGNKKLDEQVESVCRQ